MKVKIRQYQESDKPAFVKMMEELMDYIVLIDDLKVTRRMPKFGESYAQRTLQKVINSNGVVYVAELNSQLIGVVVGIIPAQSKEELLEHVPSKCGEVLELVVKAGYRGKGVGTMLISKLMEYFKENSCTMSKIEVFAPNKKAHRLYKKLGYKDRSLYMVKELQKQQ